MADNCNFPAWDEAKENDMCFHCFRAENKELMCTWIKRLKPVPGWITVRPSECNEVTSVRILRCPLFLPSKEDPGLTRQEYWKLCRELAVNLYRSLCEYRRMLLEKSALANTLRDERDLLKQENKELQSQLKQKRSGAKA